MSAITRVNYDELLPILKKFHDESEDYAQLLSTTRQKIAALHGEWAGDAADKFFEEMDNELLPAVNRLSQGLAASHEVLKNIMKTIHESDLETGSFFRDGAVGAEDFGAGQFNDALDASAVSDTNPPVVTGDAGDLPGTGSPSDPTQVEKPLDAPPTETPPEEETPEVQPAAASAGGGGGDSGSRGQGLAGMGSGLGGQTANNASVGATPGSGAEGLADHIFGGSGVSGSELPSQGGGAPAGEPASSQSGAGAAAGIGGSVAIGAAAKALKNKQDQDASG